MSTPTVPVTVTLAAQDGTPYAGVTVRARLDINEVYQGFVISDQADAVTDAGGVAVLNCFPNAPSPTGLGTQGSTYRFWAAIPGGRSLNVEALVPNTACRLENILLTTDNPPSLTDAQLAVAQAQSSVTTAATSAAAAAGSATTASGQAGVATAQAGIAATQAGIATTQAGNAAASAAAAQTVATQFGDLNTAVTSAQTSATTATTQAGIATTQAGLATTAKTGAEAARDGALQTIVTAKLFDTYANAILGTVDGDWFSVYSSSLAARLIYKRVSGQGELQGVAAFYKQPEAETARKLASSQTFDSATTLPAGARVDFVAVDSLFGFSNIRNRAYLASPNPDLNIFGRSRATDFVRSTLGGLGNTAPTSTYGVAGPDTALKAVRLQYAGSGVCVYGIAGLDGSIVIPAGRWTASYDAVSNSGTATFRAQKDGATGYAAASVGTGAFTTVSQTFVLSVDTTVGNGGWQLVREAASPSAFDITIDNFRLIPGSAAGSASPVSEHLQRPQGLTQMDGMCVKSTSVTDSGARAVVPLVASQAFTAVTAVVAVRRGGVAAAQGVIVSDNSSSFSGFGLRENSAGGVFVPGLDAGLNAADSDMIGLPLNEWVIVTTAAGPDGSSMYVNAMKVTAAAAAAYTGFTTDYFSLMGLAWRQDGNFLGKCASVLIYDRRLADGAELLRAVAVMKSRIAALGERFTDFGSFYVAEGDSITYGTGATAQRGYAKLLGQRFTPYLQGIDYGVAGNTLTNLTARAATVDAKIAEAIALGKRVIFSVLIGANELPASNAAADTYYASLKTYWAARRATGAKVIAGTVIGASGLTGGQVSALAYLNGLIRGDASQYDGLADYANNANLGTWNGTYFADTQHPNDTGHALMEAILRPIVTGLWLP